jgi:hypothetical protein
MEKMIAGPFIAATLAIWASWQAFEETRRGQIAGNATSRLDALWQEVVLLAMVYLLGVVLATVAMGASYWATSLFHSNSN